MERANAKKYRGANFQEIVSLNIFLHFSVFCTERHTQREKDKIDYTNIDIFDSYYFNLAPSQPKKNKNWLKLKHKDVKKIK